MRTVISLRETIGVDPFGLYDELRQAGEVVWDDGMHAWVVTTYGACKELERDEARFRQPYGDMQSDTFVRLEGGRRAIQLLHGADHTSLHRWWLRAFGPRAAEEWRATVVRPIATVELDRIAPGGRGDLAQLADRIPVRVIARLLGLPWDDEDWIAHCKDLLHEIVLFLDLYGVDADGADPEVRRSALAASDALVDLLEPFIDSRRDGTDDDLVSRLWRDGPGILDGWDDEDMRANVRQMFFAGSDTTNHAIANALYLLMTRPSLAERLRAERALVPAFVEEVLRVLGSVHFRPRAANVDTVLAGTRIGRGDMLVAVNAAANVDPAKYGCPFDVDLGRPAPRDHLAFSFGRRTCVGAALARVELAEVVDAVLDRLEDLRPLPGAPPPPLTGFQLRSFRPLDAVWSESGRGTPALERGG